MTNEETTIWGIHAGRTGDAHNLFLEKNLIAIGWSKAGDLTELKPNREAFKERLAETHPHLKPGTIPLYSSFISSLTKSQGIMGVSLSIKNSPYRHVVDLIRSQMRCPGKLDV